MPKLCICQICNCGRHRCPHRPHITGGQEPCKLSEYSERYLKHPMIPTESCKPQAQAIQSSDPLDDKTTNRVDYIKHPAEKPYTHAAEPYRKPDGSIDLMTNYKRDFVPKPVVPARAVKPDNARKVSGKFDGLPTYQHDYRKWDMPRRELHGNQARWEPPTASFEGDTNYRRDYKQQTGGPAMSLKPAQNAKMSDGPFDDLTNYRQDYIKHAMGAKEQREKAVYNPPKAPFDGVSTQRHDFIEKKQPVVSSCKPAAEAIRSDAPFDDHTTFKTDYRKWPTERPFHHDPDVYRKPDGDMDLHTNYARDFTSKPIQPARMMKPPANRGQPAQFEGVTTNKQDYRPWELGQRERAGPRMSYEAPAQPFEGLSNYRQNYIGHPVKPVGIIKPDGGAYQSNAPFEDGTSYRIEYTPKRQEICPAAVLDTGKSSYVYREQDPKGHKFYQPISQVITPLQTAAKPATPKLAPLRVA